MPIDFSKFQKSKNQTSQESISNPIQEKKAPKTEEKHTNSNVLSELEFKMFDNAIELIYSSNYKLYIR